MTQSLVVQSVAEVLTQAGAAQQLSSLASETLSHANPAAVLTQLPLEVALSPTPGTAHTTLAAETLSAPQPDQTVHGLVLEVLYRHTASPALYATGYDAFGDRIWKDAALPVFAFRHDWQAPLVERLLWQTFIVRVASGQEQRRSLRLIPARELRYQVGHARYHDGLVADWLADYQGRTARWPLPHYARRLAQTALAGASLLHLEPLSYAVGLPETWLPMNDALRIEVNGLMGWDQGATEIWLDAGVTAIAAAHRASTDVSHCAYGQWQVAQLAQAAQPQQDQLRLESPLARTQPAGSLVMPPVLGSTDAAANLQQLVPGLANTEVTAQIAAEHPPWTDPNWPQASGDPHLMDWPVWPDANWQMDMQMTQESVVQRMQPTFAKPWLRRADPVNHGQLQRRYLFTRAQRAEWLHRLWVCAGQYGAFWLADHAAPVLVTTQAADPDDGFLQVALCTQLTPSANAAVAGLAAFWHRPCGVQLQLPDGSQAHVLANTLHTQTDTTPGAACAVLVLGSALPHTIPANTRAVRLLPARLAHDTVELHWHTHTLIELAITAQIIDLPRGNDRVIYRPD